MARNASLYLDFAITAAPDEGAQALLKEVLDAVPVASVLLRAGSHRALDMEGARRLIATAQRKGVAALVLGDTEQARALEADGVHLPWSRDVVRQLKAVKASCSPGFIVGGDAGRSRHDAMELGEAGADYVAFGVPQYVEDRARAAERQIDLVSWWSEIFEVPCVALDVADADQARRLVEAGTDFVAVTVTTDDQPAAANDRVLAFSEALRDHEGAT